MKTIPTTISIQRAFLVLTLALALNSMWAPAFGQEAITVTYDDGRPSEEVPAWQLEGRSYYFRANDVARLFKATQFNNHGQLR